VVNGTPLTEAQLNLSLIPIVCSAFKTACSGQTPPSACGTYYAEPVANTTLCYKS
jgi:hypothetical protein